MSLVENEIISFLKTEKSYHLNSLEARYTCLIALYAFILFTYMWLDLLLELKEICNEIFIMLITSIFVVAS